MNFDLTKLAEELGWSLAGVSDLEVPEEIKKAYRTWLITHKGPQMKYLERRMNERLDPKKYFPAAQSMMCFGLYYFPGWAEGEVKVSNYAWGKDYHSLLSAKLEETIKALQSELGSFEYKICVDTAPVLEKFWAQKAGLGWQGKNTLLLNRKFGSLFFLGEVLTSLPPESFTRPTIASDHCGTCTRCIDACPTDAIEPYKLIADRCISYLNLEHKGDFSTSTPSLENWVAGCDICQEVCPWNQKLVPLEIDQESQSFQKLSAAEIESPHWLKRIQDRAINYVPPKNWARNLKQALPKKAD